MTLRLTVEMLERCYDFLSHTQPFDDWNMPDAQDVEFRVVKTPELRGWYRNKGSARRPKHVIAVSQNVIGHSHSLILVMAHEMIHLHQAQSKMETAGVQHNAAFNYLAQQVCERHGFDPKLF